MLKDQNNDELDENISKEIILMLADQLKNSLGRYNGFGLFIFPADTGALMYISNIPRDIAVANIENWVTNEKAELVRLATLQEVHEQQQLQLDLTPTQSEVANDNQTPTSNVE